MTALAFLTEDELEQLTGYRYKSSQRQWLAANGYSFDVRADGKPVVSRAHYEARHAGGSGSKNRERPSAPDFGALDRLG